MQKWALGALIATCTKLHEFSKAYFPNTGLVLIAQAQITNTAVFGGTRFATLDNIPPDRSTSGCQSGRIALPSGWNLASTGNPETYAAIFSYFWGTTCIVVADGTSHQGRSDVVCGSNQFAVDTSGRYRVTSCNRRILISQPTADAGKLSLVHRVYLIAVLGPPASVSNFVVIGTKKYAVMEDLPAQNTPVGCQRVVCTLCFSP